MTDYKLRNLVATDTIWDAAGDLAVGTGANTAAKLAIGAAGSLLGVDAAGTAYEAKSVLVSAAGEMTNASQPAFLVKTASTQTNIALNSNVTIVFGTEIFDQGGDFASNTFTAPVTGKYQFSYNLVLSEVDTDANYYVGKLITSNRTYAASLYPLFTADLNGLTLSYSVLADMDAADTAYVALYQSAGTQQTDNSDDSYFSGFLVC